MECGEFSRVPLVNMLLSEHLLHQITLFIGQTLILLVEKQNQSILIGGLMMGRMIITNVEVQQPFIQLERFYTPLGPLH
tara:strand:+ start:19694 stop:19930 length:237 start_codon:yes stop_codon:yes gene_type:complete